MGDQSFLEDLSGRVGLLDADPLDLAEPDGGGRTMTHDAEFVALDATLCEIRDVVNRGVDVLNDLGAGLPRLPEGSLEELLVHPLTGHYPRIRQNAEAVHQVGDALVTYGDNVFRLGLGVDPRWGGQAASAYLLRLSGRGLLAHASGRLIHRGSVVFDEIADFSEKLAIKVEDRIMELIERGRRLVRKLLTRAAGPAGWAVFASDVALNGLDAVTDLIDDARTILAIIDELISMKGDVEAWVEEQRGRLALLQDLRELVLEGTG